MFYDVVADQEMCKEIRRLKYPVNKLNNYDLLTAKAYQFLKV